MQAGKHVLTEKLMAHNVGPVQGDGPRRRQDTSMYPGRRPSAALQRAVRQRRQPASSWGVLGELHHIRAQWHRGNLPGNDSWQQPLPGGEMGCDRRTAMENVDAIAEQLQEAAEGSSKDAKDPAEATCSHKKVAQWEAWMKDADVEAEDYGYEDRSSSATARTRTALEELVRWRLWERTGGGLMAELGSHQLDAASIFCTRAARRTARRPTR